MSLVSNKKAHLNYEILEKFEAGIELLGFEVKAIKNNQGSLEAAHVGVRGGEAFLLNFDLPPYQAKNTPESYDRVRARKLLLTKKEIKYLADEGGKKGIATIPLSIFLKGIKIKVDLALARGKKKFDKRESLKKKDADREIRREMKH
ncbi:MAG: SsrA-binding protein SmpB [Patescibacteria group bacterium]